MGRTEAEVMWPVLGFFNWPDSIMEPLGDTWPRAVRGCLMQPGKSPAGRVALTDELRWAPGWADSGPRGRIQGRYAEAAMLGIRRDSGSGGDSHSPWDPAPPTGAAGWGRQAREAWERGRHWGGAPVSCAGALPGDVSLRIPALAHPSCRELIKWKEIWLLPRAPGSWANATVCAPGPGSWIRGCFVPAQIGPSHLPRCSLAQSPPRSQPRAVWGAGSLVALPSGRGARESSWTEARGPLRRGASGTRGRLAAACGRGAGRRADRGVERGGGCGFRRSGNPALLGSLLSR